MCGEAVPEGVARCCLVDSRCLYGRANRSLENGFVEMVSAPLAGLSIPIGSSCWKHPLPNPLAASIGVFARERGRKFFARGGKEVV